MLNRINYGLKTQIMITERCVYHERRGNVVENVASQTYSLNLSSTTEQSISTSTSRIKLTDLSTESKDVSGKIIGLSIGLPVGIFCFSLLIFLAYFYFIKNSILLSVQPVSPSESIKEPSNTWFDKFFNLNCIHRRQDNNDIEKKYRISSYKSSNYHVSESQIQYKIGIDPYNCKQYVSCHVQTPKDVHSKYPREKLQLLDKLSCNYVPKPHFPLTSDVQFTINKRNEGNDYDHDCKYPNVSFREEDKNTENFISKLVDNSFLDKETHRSSVYQKINNLLPRLTPTIQLKNLKILSRIDKNYVHEPVEFENERSPMLDKSCSIYSHNVNVFNLSNSNAELCGSSLSIGDTVSEKIPIQGKYALTNYSIKKQVLDGNRVDANSKIVIEPVPLKRINFKKANIKAKRYKKELPEIPYHMLLEKEKGKDSNQFNTVLKVGRVYPVVRPYSPRLIDEISLSMGEYVRVLVVYEDNKWCLVEKCTMDGTSKSLINFGNQMRNDRKYLNDDRGIIPTESILKK